MRLQKYQRSKLEVDKKSAASAGPRRIGFEVGRVGNFLCDLQLWPQIFLQPLDLQECTVPHLKDLIHICLELEAQGCGMTFNRFYVGSKYPYFISYRGKWVYLFCRGCIYTVSAVIERNSHLQGHLSNVHRYQKRVWLVQSIFLASLTGTCQQWSGHFPSA